MVGLGFQGFKAPVGFRVSLVGKEFGVERVQGLMVLKGRLESSCMCACLTGAYGGLGSEYRYHNWGVYVSGKCWVRPWAYPSPFPW